MGGVLCLLCGTKKAETWPRPLPPPSSLEMSVTIWCFLVGGPNLFPVDIDPTNTVAHLKIKIKEENPLDLKNIAPVYLKLYRLEVDDSDDEQNLVNHFNQLAQNSNMGDPLNSWTPLSEIWIEAPQGKRYRIVIQAPKGESI